MNIGDLVWQDRMPGGWCTVLDIYDKPYSWLDDDAGMSMGWGDLDYPILKVAHPTEGIIEDPSYYYLSVEDYVKIRVEGKKRLPGPDFHEEERKNESR